MSIARERLVEQLIVTAGFRPSLVGIGRDDDRPWATFRSGSEYVRLVGDGLSDDAAAADIVRQARENGIVSKLIHIE